MANELAEGLYHIVNAHNGLALDLAGNSTADRANIQVHDRNYSDAQVWDVSYRADGTCQILHRYSGKSMEVYGLDVRQGANVSLYTDNDTDAQRWQLVRTGGTVAVDGATYQTWWIKLVYDSTFVAELFGTPGTDPMGSGTNVVVAANQGGAADQHWAFVPVALWRDEGIYEVLSLVDTSMCWDVDGLSKANGANLMLGTRNGGNNQKFSVESLGGGLWGLRSVHSGKYMHVAGARLANDQNVHQWEGASASQAQTAWSVAEYGTMRVDGVECQVVAFATALGRIDGLDVLVDAQGALAANRTNLMVCQNNQGSNQRWALLPTSPAASGVPAPRSLGLAEAVGLPGGLAKKPQARLYPTWESGVAWMAGVANHFRFRWRSRLMPCATGTWGAWSAWSAWRDAAVTVDGARCWLTEGIPADYSFGDPGSKDMQAELQVMAVGGDDGSSALGPVADAVCEVVRRPRVALSSASWSPEGLRLAYSTDYRWGEVLLHVSSLRSGPEELLGAKVACGGAGASGAALVPASSLLRWPEDGETLAVTYTVGNDRWPEHSGDPEAGSVAVSYDAGSGASATPSLARGEGRTLVATVPHVGEERMWLVAGGRAHELDGATSGGSTSFVVPFPFGVGFSLLCSVRSSSGAAWGTSATHVAADDPLVSWARPCHAWDFGGSEALLELREGGALSTDLSVRPDVETVRLVGRSRQTARLGTARDREVVAEGSLVPGASGSGRADLEALADAGLALYRSPHGDVMDVVVTGVSVSQRHDRTSATVSMSEVEQ